MTPRRLSSRIALPPLLGDAAELGQKRRRERIAALAAEVDDAHARHRRADPGREDDPLERRPALGPRRRAAVDRDRAFEGGALRGHGARVVAGIGLLLVRRVVLLVDDHEPEVAHRREDRRPRADDDPRLAARDPVALVAPLGLPERRVEDRDRVAEALPEPADRLRRERDLRHEHDRAEPARERRLAGLEVDLGLAAPGRPDEQEMRGLRAVEPGDDPRDRRLLLRRQLGGRGLTGERLALDRRRSLAARRPPQRRDELERARGRRAVVVGDPEREVDERGRDLVEHLPGRRELDPGGRLDADLDDDAARRAARRAAPGRSRPCRRRRAPRR